MKKKQLNITFELKNTSIIKIPAVFYQQFQEKSTKRNSVSILMTGNLGNFQNQ